MNVHPLLDIAVGLLLKFAYVVKLPPFVNDCVPIVVLAVLNVTVHEYIVCVQEQLVALHDKLPYPELHVPPHTAGLLDSAAVACEYEHVFQCAYNVLLAEAL